MNKLMNTSATLVAGAAFSAAIILACGDDSPGAADAACNCPAAEAPLAGRIVIVEDEVTDQANTTSSAVARCASGGSDSQDWILLGGGCYVEDSSLNGDKTHLYDAGPSASADHPLGAGYRCTWANPNQFRIDKFVARAICLVPSA